MDPQRRVVAEEFDRLGRERDAMLAKFGNLSGAKLLQVAQNLGFYLGKMEFLVGKNRFFSWEHHFFWFFRIRMCFFFALIG